MAKITVYLYELPDPFSGVAIRSRTPATRRAIDAAGGTILLDTAQEVELMYVTDDGIVQHWPLPEGRMETPEAGEVSVP
jgi:hypothetical protein